MMKKNYFGSKYVKIFHINNTHLPLFLKKISFSMIFKLSMLLNEKFQPNIRKSIYKIIFFNLK